MTTDLPYTITANLALFGVGYIVGYVIGRLDLILCKFCSCADNDHKPKTAAYFTKESNKHNDNSEIPPRSAIKIDESKYVGEIKTDNLIKAENIEFGSITAATDNIDAAVSKLAQRKGK
jgi:hypothetical protein